MRLSNDLINQFAKLTKVEKQKQEVTVYGTIVENDGVKYIKLDGSAIMTPAFTTVDVLVGDRVTAMIKNHSVVITGNLSSPSARKGMVEALENKFYSDGVSALTNSEIDVLVAGGSDVNEVSAASFLNSSGLVHLLSKINVPAPIIQTVTLSVGSWDSSTNEQIASVFNVTSSTAVIISAAPASQDAYTTAGVRAVAQDSETVTFRCETIPESDLVVNIMVSA